MNKTIIRTSIFVMLAMVLLVHIPFVAFAQDTGVDPYEVFDPDETLLFQMMENPPVEIVLVPVLYYRMYYDPIPISGEIKLTKGKVTSYSLHVIPKVTDSGQTSTITSTINFDYRGEKDDYDNFVVIDTHTYGDPTVYKDGLYSKEYGNHDVFDIELGSSSTSEGGLDPDSEYFTFVLGVDQGEAQQADGNLGIIYLEVKSVKMKSGGLVSVDTDASITIGETGIEVPTIFIVGVLSAVALGGVLFLFKGKKNKGKKKETSTFKIYINKDFGDTITFNKPPVPIYARMGEITSKGELIDRPDLTKNITISTKSAIVVENCSLVGDYMGANLSANSTSPNDESSTGTVSFRYVGEVGTVENNVTFKLRGEPYISFVDRKKALTPTVDMIYGDQKNYTMNVELVDFMKPAELTLSEVKDIPFTIEIEKKTTTSFFLTITNESESTKEKMYKNKVYELFLTAENDTEKASDTFRINLVPEGLSLRDLGRQFDELGNLLVACYADPDGDVDNTEIIPTRFELILAISETSPDGKNSVKMVDMNTVDLRFNPLEAEIEKLKNLIKVFKYDVEKASPNHGGIHRFSPHMQLPKDEKLDYNVTLPVSCEYNQENYKLDIPLQLMGDAILPMAGKEEEIQILLRRIKMYVNPERVHLLIKEIKQDLAYMSVTEVRLLSKSIVYMSQAAIYDAHYNKLFADMMDWYIWGLEWIKWTGDQAFSLILTNLLGPSAPLADAFLSPAKDLVVSLMAENIWYREGISSPDAKLKTIETTAITSLENAIMSQLDADTDIKKAGRILAAFAVIRAINHYWYDKDDYGNPIGFYDALIVTLGDITQTAFKSAIGMKFEAFLKDPQKNPMFGDWIDLWLKKIIPTDFWTLVSDTKNLSYNEEVFKKYVEEGVGLMGSKLYPYVEKAGKKLATTDTFTIELGINPNDPSQAIYVDVSFDIIRKHIYDYMFNQIFSNFPFLSKALEFEEDPPVLNIR